jgi:hypothetical protein
MLALSDPTRFRRGLGSASLLLAPLLGLAAAVIAPPSSSNTAADLALISAHHSAFVAEAVLEAAAWIVFIPGVLGIVHLLRQRGVVLGHVGGVLAILGMISFVAESAIAQATAVLAEDAGHRAVYAQAVYSMRHSPLAAFVLLALLGEIGLILLAVAMRRARRAPGWVVAATAVAVLVDFAPIPDPLGLIITWLLLGLAFGRIGWAIRTTSDAEWEQPGEPVLTPATAAA